MEKSTRGALSGFSLRLLMAALLVCLVGVLAACGSDDDSDAEGTTSETAAEISVQPRKIGVVDLIRQSPIDDKTDTLIEQAGKELGWDVQVQDAAGDPAKVASAADAFVNQGVDALILVSVDANLVRKQLQRARQAGIPTIHTTSGTQESDLWDAAYSEDETRMATELVQHIVETVPDTKLIDLKTTLNHAGSERADAVVQTIADSPGAEIVGDSDVDLTNPAVNTQKDLTALLQANPDANAVHAVFDNMAQAAANTVKTQRSDAKVYSYFTTENNIELLKNGGLAAVMDNDLAKAGAVAIDELLGYFEKDDPIDPDAMDKPDNSLTYRVITKEDIEEIGGDGDPFPISESLDPFLQKWAEEYPAGG